MRRAWRDRPRVLAAQGLGLALLVAVAAGVGALIASSGPDVPPGAQRRQDTAEATVRAQRNTIRTERSATSELRGELVGARRALRLAHGRARSESRRRATALRDVSELRRAQRLTRRALARERRRR